MKKFHPVALILFFFLSGITLFSQSPDTTKNKDLFEISFGQSLLFFSERQLTDLHANESIVAPTSSILFFLEFFPKKRVRLPVFFNIPTAGKQFLVNNQLITERASPSFGLGGSLKCLHLSLSEKTKLEFEMGPTASFLLTTSNRLRFVPILAGRVVLLKGKDFIMYLGPSYSYVTNTWGLFYGTGTTF